MERALRNYGLSGDDVDLLVASDAEVILGIGDWGADGIAISTAKLGVYTAAAGIDPDRVIPVLLDVGTDRETLLNDPLYVGNRHARVRGDRYDALVDAYVEAASRLFPNALLHFEDFWGLERAPHPRPLPRPPTASSTTTSKAPAGSPSRRCSPRCAPRSRAPGRTTSASSSSVQARLASASPTRSARS